MKKRSIYLAGPIKGCSDEECFAWRKHASGLLAPEFDVSDPSKRDYRGRELEAGITQKIVEQDKLDIYLSSAVIVNFSRPSVGTSMEVLHAWQISRPVFIINATAEAPSPWLAYHCQCILSSLEEAVDTLKAHFARIDASPRPDIGRCGPVT